MSLKDLDLDPDTVQRAKARMDTVSKTMRVVRISETRTLKVQGGDLFVGFTSDVGLETPEGHVSDILSGGGGGIPLNEVKQAHLVLGWTVDRAIAERALATGHWSEEQYKQNLSLIEHNYVLLLGKGSAKQSDTTEEVAS